MSTADDPCTIGIMHDAFRKGSTLLIKFLNDCFQMNYKKVEEVSSGAIFCQMCHVLYDSPKLKTVKWAYDKKGKPVRLSERDKINNWKKVQNVFNKKGITKKIEMGKYIQGKFQDNLEVLQWFKHFFQYYYTGKKYDAYKERYKVSKKNGPGAIVMYWDDEKRVLTESDYESIVSSSPKATKVSKKKKKRSKKSQVVVHQVVVVPENKKKKTKG